MIHLSMIPNLLSLSRMLCVIPWAWCVVRGDYQSAFLLLVVAAVTDGLDGWSARRFQWTSRLGSILDPLADKVLCNGVFWTLAWMNWVPWWLALLLTIRDLVIIAGAWLCWSRLGAYDMKPSFWGKWAMGSTVLLMWWLVLSSMLAVDMRWIDVLLTVSMASAVTVSLANYVAMGRQLLRDYAESGYRSFD